MQLRFETKNIQEQFAKYCKTGDETTFETVLPNRIEQYRRLVFNTVANSLVSAFPITYEWLNVDEWHLLVNDFFKIHKAQTPSIWKLPEEFVNFIVLNNYAKRLNRLALDDLLRFEWLEIDVHTMPDVSVPLSSTSIFSVDAVLFIDPHYRIQQLKYPVHTMHANDAINKNGEYYVLVYRMLDSGQVQFMQLSPLHVLLIDEIAKQSQALKAILPRLVSRFGNVDLYKIKEHLTNFCINLINKKILIIT